MSQETTDNDLSIVLLLFTYLFVDFTKYTIRSRYLKLKYTNLNKD